MTAFNDQIDAILNEFSGATTSEEVETALGKYDTRDLLAVVATRVLAAATGGGGGSSLVRSATVTLDDAQIKALPTTPAVIIPATETPNYATSLTEVPVIVGGLMLANNYAVAYTNADAASSLVLSLGTDSAAWGSVAVMSLAVGGGDEIAQLIAGPFTNTTVPGAFIGPVGLPFERSFEDNAVRLVMDNQGAGDLTGGDPTNTLQVTLLYAVVALT